MTKDPAFVGGWNDPGLLSSTPSSKCCTASALISEVIRFPISSSQSSPFSHHKHRRRAANVVERAKACKNRLPRCKVLLPQGEGPPGTFDIVGSSLGSFVLRFWICFTNMVYFKSLYSIIGKKNSKPLRTLDHKKIQKQLITFRCRVVINEWSLGQILNEKFLEICICPTQFSE